MLPAEGERMEVVVELLVFAAGGLVALVASRWVLGGVLALTFKPADGPRPPVRKAAGA